MASRHSPGSPWAITSPIAVSSRAIRSTGTEPGAGLPMRSFELRQDLILGEEGQAEWAERLAIVVREVLRAGAAPGSRLHAIEHYGSHTDCASDASG